MDLLQFHDLGVHLSLTGTLGAILVVVIGAWVSQKPKSDDDAANDEASTKAG